MRKSIIASLLLTTALSVSANETEIKDIDFSNLTDKQKTDLNIYIKNYILENPAILYQAADNYKNQEIENQFKHLNTGVITNVDKILNDPNTPYIGPKDSKKAVVLFFDYNCVYCSMLAIDLEKIIKKNPEVKFIFKDMPIFEKERATSKYAAQIGVKVFKEKGGESYFNYHNDIFRAGRDERGLEMEEVNDIAKKYGVESIEKLENADIVDESMLLSQTLKIIGTPTLIFLPTSNQSEDNVRVIMKDLKEDALQQQIDKL